MNLINLCISPHIDGFFCQICYSTHHKIRKLSLIKHEKLNFLSKNFFGEKCHIDAISTLKKVQQANNHLLLRFFLSKKSIGYTIEPAAQEKMLLGKEKDQGNRMIVAKIDYRKGNTCFT